MERRYRFLESPHLYHLSMRKLVKALLQTPRRLSVAKALETLPHYSRIYYQLKLFAKLSYASCLCLPRPF